MRINKTLGGGWNKCGGISDQTQHSYSRWNRNHELCYGLGLHVLIINAVLTGQTVQLFSECCHDDVILHNVRHLVLHVLLIECDQGIRAGIPNLNTTLVMPVVHKSLPLNLSTYIWEQKRLFIELNTSKLLAAVGAWHRLHASNPEWWRSPTPLWLTPA